MIKYSLYLVAILSTIFVQSKVVYARVILTDYIYVTATVRAACRVDPDDLDFDPDDITGAGNFRSQASVNVHCPAGTDYKIELSSGAGYENAAKDDALRKMTGAGNELLDYELFLDADYQDDWGGVNQKVADGYIKDKGTGKIREHKIYGEIYSSDRKVTNVESFGDKTIVIVSY